MNSPRLVSYEHRHLAAISCQVAILNAEAPLVISSKIDNDEERRRARQAAWEQ